MLHTAQSGVGPTIVLLHGFCENKTCFNEQVLLLKNDFHVVTIDLPGFGHSAVTPNTTMQSMADEVYATLTQLNVQPCVMIGHSMGGYVTLAFAQKYPQLLSGFGLLHSTARADNEERKEKRDQATAFIKSTGAEKYVRNFVPQLFNAPADEKLLTRFVDEALKLQPVGLTEALQAMKNRSDSTEFIARTNMPVLYIAGKYDALIPHADLLKQAASATCASYVLLEQSAHMGMVEEPETCAQAIRQFAAFCFAK